MIIMNVTKIHRFISLVHMYVEQDLCQLSISCRQKKCRSISTGCDLVQWEEHKKGHDVNAMMLT